MTEYKRYDSASETTHFNVRLVKDPEHSTTPKGVELVKLTVVRTAKNERFLESVFVQVTYRKDDSQVAYALARLKKGDIVTVSGDQFYRLYEVETGEGKKRTKETRLAAEIPFGKRLVVHSSLKDREVAEAPVTDAPPTDDLPF